MIHRIQDIPFYYEQYGAGRPVLCLHGYSVDHRLMTGCLEPVFAQTPNYRRIYLDLPGMGRTPAAPWLRDAGDMLACLKAFAAAVMPDEPFLLIGESYGGYLALGLLHDMPASIAGALLICPVIRAEDQDRRLPPARTPWISADFHAAAREASQNGFLYTAALATPAIYESYRRDILPGIALADTAFLARYHEEGYAFAFENDFLTMTFDRPMCILTGRQDHTVGYADALALIEQFPRMTFALLDHAGHNLQIENPPLFEGHVNDWLQRAERER